MGRRFRGTTGPDCRGKEVKGMKAVGTVPPHDLGRWVAIIGPRGYKYPPGGAPSGRPHEQEQEAPTLADWERCVADRRQAYRLGAAVVRQGGVVVSGLAKGIDAAAHAGALAMAQHLSLTHPVTVAVVNTPPEEPVYPWENRDLAQRIRAQGCTLHPFTQNDRERERVEREEQLHPPRARLPSVFTRRLWERDFLIAALSGHIFCVDSRPRITGGTAWGCSGGKRLGRKVFRVDAAGTLYPDPDCEQRSYWWQAEYDLRPDAWQDLPHEEA